MNTFMRIESARKASPKSKARVPVILVGVVVGGLVSIGGWVGGSNSRAERGERTPRAASMAAPKSAPKAAAMASAMGVSPVIAPAMPEAASCANPGPGRSDCGSSHESCCASLPVPGGKFLMEYDGVEDKDSSHEAEVADYRLDKYEVTVGRFRSFVEAWARGYRPAAGAGKHSHLHDGKGLSDGANGYEGGWQEGWSKEVPRQKAVWDEKLACDKDAATWTSEPEGKETRPINCVTWYEAVAFCIWDGGHLPSEAEWNYAASGGDEQRYYPWSKPRNSTEITADHAVYASSTMQAVGSKKKGAGRWGQMDLAGNVWEWNLDWYDKLGATSKNCANVRNGSYRVIRGGGFFNGASRLRASDRYYDFVSPGDRFDFLGLRCSRTPSRP